MPEHNIESLRAWHKPAPPGRLRVFAPVARREGSRLTAERLVEVQRLLDQGQAVPQISAALNILPSTLHKAIHHGRLKKKRSQPLAAQR